MANDDAPPNRIRELRDAKGLTQAQLAALANVTPSALNKLELGSRGLDQQWLRRLAPLLDCNPADLLPDEDNPNRPGDEEQELLRMWRSADPTQRKQLYAMMRALLSPDDLEGLMPAAA